MKMHAGTASYLYSKTNTKCKFLSFTYIVYAKLKPNDCCKIKRMTGLVWKCFFSHLSNFEEYGNS